MPKLCVKLVEKLYNLGGSIIENLHNLSTIAFSTFYKKPSYVDRYGSYSHVLNKFSTHSSTIKYSLLTDKIIIFSTISTVLITMSTELINKGFNNIYEINR